MNDTVNSWLENRVTALTGKSTAELREIGEEINSRAFFVAKLSTASVANPLREISDDYVKGKITLSEAQQRIRDMASGSTDDIARQLATRTRSAQILQNQRQMARGVAEWQSWQDNKEDFPYIIYHANQDGFVRESHKALDGKVFRVDDPFLQTHMPGEWDYNCRCWGEQVTKKRAERDPAKIQAPGKADYTAESGYMFNPANAFMPDASQLKDRPAVIHDMEESVRSGRLDKIGMIVKPPQPSQLLPSKQALPQAAAVSEDLGKATKAANDFLRQCGVDEPKSSAQYKAVNHELRQYAKETLGMNKKAAKEFSREIPDAVRDDIPDDTLPLGNLDKGFADAAGIGQLPVTLEKGAQHYGMSHLWHDHKDLFLNPKEAERILRETLGTPGCQMVVGLKGADVQSASRGRALKVCRKRFVLHNPKTRAYLVMRLADDGESLQVVSFNRAPEAYGMHQWEIE